MNIILLQAGGDGNMISTIVLMVGIMVIFYFFMIRPQINKQKKEKEFRDGIKQGDRVITMGGIYGKIIKLEDDSVLLEIDNNVKIRLERAAIRDFATKEQVTENK